LQIRRPSGLHFFSAIVRRFPSIASGSGLAQQPHGASSAICASNHARSSFQIALSGERAVMRTMMARPCSVVFWLFLIREAKQSLLRLS
jgi:hypothetical protein